MTFAQIIARLDVIADTGGAIEHALRDGDIAKAVDQTVRLAALVVDLRMRLTQQAADAN